MPPACLYVRAYLPACHLGSQAAKHSGPSAVILQGWITAIATAGLLIGAIITAVYAIKAFRAQSVQLAEQRKINQQQTGVLALQADELRESLAERKREALERRNSQAAQTHLVVKQVARSREGGPDMEATVVNAAERQQPIYDAKLYWHLGPEGHGTPNPELLGTVLNWEKEPRRREFPRGADPADCGAVLAFRDAYRVDWIKTPDGGAMKADSELLPDVVRRLFGTPGNGASIPHMARDVGEWEI